MSRMSLAGKTIAFFGAGQMAEALIRGLLAQQVVRPEQIIAHDIRPDRLVELHEYYGIRTGRPDADVIILAVKPQQIPEAVGDLKSQYRNRSLLISIAAGITTGRLEREIGGEPRVVRAMPNTPALVGAGAAAICRGAHATEADLTTAEGILGAVGIVLRVEERLMDAVTALSGSGPAYLFYVIEALIDGGVQAGLPEITARQLAMQTLWGAGKLLRESNESPAELRRKVTSPGGTTEAALKVMVARGVPSIFAAAMAAAVQRGRELAGN